MQSVRGATKGGKLDDRTERLRESGSDLEENAVTECANVAITEGAHTAITEGANNR
jgi:hypothetical protein